MSSASGVVTNPGSKPRGAGVRTIVLREGIRLRLGGSAVYGVDVVGQVVGLVIDGDMTF